MNCPLMITALLGKKKSRVHDDRSVLYHIKKGGWKILIMGKNKKNNMLNQNIIASKGADT